MMDSGDLDRTVKAHLLNFVGGHGMLAASTASEAMESHLQRTEALYQAYPEIPGGELLPQDVKSDHLNVVAMAYGTTLQMVIAVANLSPQPVQATLWIPGMGSLLFDRMDEQHLPLAGGLAWMELPGYSQFAYELR